MSIGAIIAYVDSSDNHWRNDYVKATGVYSIPGVRFRDWDTLRYLMRGISEYMPFIDEIIVLVSRESQVPKWLDTSRVRIVYHSEFIPKQLLPTFNSCTIESFLWNIPNLPDKILYFNDDMIPINKLEVSDFFTENTPHIRFREHMKYIQSNMFRCQCRSGINAITSLLKIPYYPAGEIIKPDHTIAPMLKSTLQTIGDTCNKLLIKSSTILRNKININQYIYLYYHFFTDDYVDSECRFYYFEMKDDLTELSDILNSNVQIVCINDKEEIKNYKSTKSSLISLFETKFPNKSNYEK